MGKGISAKQLKFSVGLFIIASNLLTKNLYPYTKNETWIAVVLATAVSFVIVSVYGKLAERYPGLGMFKINEAVFGNAAGRLVSVFYLFFFFSLVVFNTRDMGSFVSSYVLRSTPLNLIYGAFLIICIYAVKKGAAKMTQYSALILFVYLILLVILTCLLIPKMQPQNFHPVFMIPFKNTLLSMHSVTMLPYTEIFAFLMMAEQFIKPEASGKALRMGLLIGAAVILFLVVRDTAVLGGYVLYIPDPTFSTIRLIDVGDILTRLEIINAVLLITLLFFKVSILLYAVTAGIGQLFNIRESKVFSLIIGVLTVICANVFFVSSSEHQMWFRAAATYSTFFLFILPLLTLVVSMIRKPAADGPEENLRQQ